MMALELYMVGLVTKNMEKSLEFYQQLGLAIPEGSEKGQPAVLVKMQSGVTFFLLNRPGDAETSDSARTIFEFFLPNQTAVDEKHAEMIDAGARSLRAPAFEASMNVYFALISDPDEHTVMLSAE